MDRIRRIFVEKKGEAAVEAQGLYRDLKENLGIAGLSAVRLLNCYDVAGISEETYERSKTSVFSEPTVDMLYEETFNQGSAVFVFAAQYLPGQFDQRADSAEQGIQALLGDSRDNALPSVASSKVYLLSGQLSLEDQTKIKDYVINPVDSQEISLEKPESLSQNPVEPGDVEILTGFTKCDSDGLQAFHSRLGLAMSKDDIRHCQNYFRDEEKRDPTISEIRVLDTYWSDHCRHTTFLTNIKNVTIEEGRLSQPIQAAYSVYLKEKDRLYGPGKKETTLMNIAQMGMKILRDQGYLTDLDESEEINACSIVVDVDVDGAMEQWLIMFKNETHNHPTEIEPYGGAATCLGGAIRDPLSGRSYVYQAMRVTGSGDPRAPVANTLEGKLPQRKITTTAAHGYSSYGNQIGLATGQVSEIYHEGYIAKRMEIGAVIGAAKKENVIRETPVPGDIVLLVGGRTGRDGCGGATGSSKEHTEESILTSGAEVQKGNPPTERKLQRLFRNPAAAKLIKRCNDFGAGGVSVAIGELADGLIIDLSQVPKKYEGLDGTELAISESQERMAVVVSPEDAAAFMRYAAEENLEATKVAQVTEEKRLAMDWRGKRIIDISRAFLDTNGAAQFIDVTVKNPEPRKETGEAAGHCGDVKTKWLQTLGDLNVCCQKGLGERFDSTIGASTVLMPFGGKYQLTPSLAMAAKVPVPLGKTKTASMMAYGFDPAFAHWSPFHSAVYAVVDSIGKIVASGGSPQNIRLTFQEYFEKLGGDPVRWGKPFAALLGALTAQLALKAPSIGGKDSMSGSFKDMDVPPTLVSFAVQMANVDHVISPEFKKAGSAIILLPCPYDGETLLPDFPYLNMLNEKAHKAIKAGQVISAHTIGPGGVCGALSKMAFGNGIGFNIKYEGDFFSPNYGGLIVETSLTENEIADILSGINYTVLGQTAMAQDFQVNGILINGDEALAAWMSPLEEVFPTNWCNPIPALEKTAALFTLPDRDRIFPKKPVARPKVLIPVFPGTNCEYDMAQAFELAGAETKIFVVRNLTVNDLQESIDHMAAEIQTSQIIALPGGFSAGDEPDGSGKFIAAVFRNPKLSDAVMDLLKNRDGLAIGICNGFQALVKLGLLPFGEIKEMEESWPTLTFNEIGRHISCIARTRIVSNKSPWLWGVAPGSVHNVAVSHGEGRFIAFDEVIRNLAKEGQIATQYVDFEGRPTYDIRHNPNGSVWAVEGITSPDGRVFGKMGHTERAGSYTFKNMTGDTNQGIFHSGVKYFS